MNELRDILQKYDDPQKKGFEYHEVAGEINQLPDEQVKTPEVQSELLAMAFTEGGKQEWGTFFGPTWIGKDKLTDETVYSPDIKYVKSQHLEYWEVRSMQTSNPYMRMRYAGLVFDMKKLIENADPDYRKIKIPYIQAILEVVDGEYYKHEVCGFYYLERAFVCAIALHNVELIRRAKNSLFILNARYREELESPGLWGYAMTLMIRYIDKFTQEEQEKLVHENEKRYNALLDTCRRKGHDTDRYTHILKDEAIVLCEYFEKIGRQERIEGILDGVNEAIHISADARGMMWYQGMLSQMQALYRKHHLYKQANKLYVDIQSVGKKVLNEMQKIETSIPLDRDLVERYRADVLRGTHKEVLERFIEKNVPNIDKEKEMQAEEARHSVLLSLISTTLYDGNGNPQTRLGKDETGERYALMHGMWKRMISTSILFRIQINAMEQEGIYNFETVLGQIQNGAFIAEGHLPIIERGLRAYFDGDYLSACHILIPQFEAGVRQLVLLKGGEILRANADPKDGDEYRSLEGLLNSDEIKSILSEDELMYFENLFTAKTGGNFRNMVSHGLFPAEYFNNTMADRIIHAFLVLSNVTI